MPETPPEKSTWTLLHELIQAARRYGSPRFLRTDNEPVFTSRGFRVGLRLLGITPQRIIPGCPWQNGRVERLIGTVKGALERWDRTHSATLDEALGQIRTWYNYGRPHQHLHGLTPAEAWAGVDVFSATPEGRAWQKAWERRYDQFGLALR